MTPPLAIRIDGARDAWVPRARWVLEEFAAALGRRAEFVGRGTRADLTYAPVAPVHGVWIPADRTAQGFFEHRRHTPSDRVHRDGDLTLIFPPHVPGAAVPGDIVASAFFLMARWDEWCVRQRDEFDRLRLSHSSFGRLAGLDLADPPVEGYLARLRELLGIAPPTAWTVYLTHDIDRIRRHTPKRLAGMVRRGGPRALATLAGPDPWNNIPQMLWTSTRRGLAPTVYFIGRNRHRLDGTPRATYERTRADMARAVHAAGGEVGLHGSFGASEDGAALRDELVAFRAETGLPVRGIRYHYLRFRYHETVRWLEEAGVEYDSSLGFSAAPGYAAGIARPFRPYLLGDERPAGLRLVPLAVMDTTLHSQLGLDADAARERALAVLDATRRAGGASALLWHNTYFNDDRAPGYGPLWEDLLDELADRGARMGPVRPPADPTGASLAGTRVVHLTSVHRPRDVRIFHKEAAAAGRAGADAGVLALAERVRRGRRLVAGLRLAREASRRDADVYHVHDPELLPAALWLRHRTGRPVVYDVHEYLGDTVRTKRWLPTPLRRPMAGLAERAERAGALRVDGVVGVNEDLAARFADAGQRTVSVTNAPWGSAYPAPPPTTDPVVLYVGGLGPQRGLPLMKEAWPHVTTPGARLVLAGPGEPGDLPDGVEWLGVVDHAEVAGLLAAAAVAWVPLQRHPNYAKAVPTKLVEAMASARPVVASDFGRMAMMVRAAGCGLLVTPDDPAAHAAAIDALLDDPALAARLGASGRQAFEEGWSFERQADRLTSFYADVIHRKGRR